MSPSSNLLLSATSIIYILLLSDWPFGNRKYPEWVILMDGVIVSIMALTAVCLIIPDIHLAEESLSWPVAAFIGNLLVVSAYLAKVLRRP